MPQFIHQPHDKLFKLSMSDLLVAKEFLQTYLPPSLLALINLTELKLEKHSFIDEAYKTHEADMIYQVRLNHQTAYIYILCEQQTQVDPHMALRLWTYTLRLIKMHLRQHPTDPLPLVYPIVVYSGQKPWNAPLEIFPLFGAQETLAREWLFKPYQLVDIHRIDDEALKQQTWGGLVQFALKYREVRDFAAFLESFLPWLHAIETQKPQGLSLSKVMLQYLIDGMAAEDIELFIEKVNSYLSTELRGEAMTLAQAFERRGKQQGIEQGRQQGMAMGIQEGQAKLMIALLKERFGDLPLSYLQQIKEADSSTLLLWTKKILSAKTLDEIFDISKNSDS